MTIVAFLCFIALVAAWFIAPKEMAVTEVVPVVQGAEIVVPVAS